RDSSPFHSLLVRSLLGCSPSTMIAYLFIIPHILVVGALVMFCGGGDKKPAAGGAAPAGGGAAPEGGDKPAA
ncbi:hypothetical protein PFISCL1PPCAC_6561, partial [Pristionchus fissidentatus]